MRRPEFIARQSACPSGFLGRLIGRVMAVETASANRIAVDLVDVQETDHVLEIGFGHGTTIAALAERARLGCRFVLGWRADPDAARQFPEPTYRFPSEDTVQEMLTAAGFHRVGLSRETVGRATLHFAVAETPDTSLQIWRPHTKHFPLLSCWFKVVLVD